MFDGGDTNPEHNDIPAGPLIAHSGAILNAVERNHPPTHANYPINSIFPKRWLSDTFMHMARYATAAEKSYMN